MMLDRHNNGEKYDFAVRQPDDTFQVPDIGELDATQFDNFIAGFAAGYMQGENLLKWVYCAVGAFRIGRHDDSSLRYLGDNMASWNAIGVGFQCGCSLGDYNNRGAPGL